MNKENNSQNSTEKVSSVDQSRRKLTKAGIAGPVILSLSSKPVWAVNCTLSGVLSGNASNPQREQDCPLPGMSRQFWINNTDCWPDPFEPNTNFDRFFAGGTTSAIYGPLPNGGTFMEVLERVAIPVDSIQTACGTNSSALADSLALKNPNGNFQEMALGMAKDNSDQLVSDLRVCASEAVASILNETVYANQFATLGRLYPLNNQVVPLLQNSLAADINGCTPPNTLPPSHMNDATNTYLLYINPWNP